MTDIADGTLREAQAALKPLSDAVYNDNGDMTISCPVVTADQCIAAYFVTKKFRSQSKIVELADDAQIAVLLDVADLCADIVEDVEAIPGWKDSGPLLGIRAVAGNQIPRLQNIAANMRRVLAVAHPTVDNEMVERAYAGEKAANIPDLVRHPDVTWMRPCAYSFAGAEYPTIEEAKAVQNKARLRAALLAVFPAKG